MKNRSYRGMAAVAVLPLLAASCAVLKGKKTTTKAATPVVVVKPDSVKSAVKPYKEVVTSKAVTQKGLFTVHQLDSKYLFELADSILGRDILVVTRLSKSTPGAGNFGGEELNEQVVRWEKGPANNVFLRIITLISTADSTNQIYKAVENSNLYPIAAAFDIKAKGKDDNGVVIDVTDFLKGDNVVLAFTPAAKRAYSLTMLAADRSYISSVRSFPINTEVRSIKTYQGAPPAERAGLPGISAAGAVTLELNNSFILLPKTPMKKRYFDYRVGYFASDYNLFGDDQQKAETETYIHRWRLEPRAEDLEKWKRGELVEPAKPIVYYIDPATPKKWRPYLIAGINDWSKAFERAGFKNAISGKEWPENDTTMSLEDARFSVIRYYAATIENAYGPNVADPRSGEIIESHVGWYHNVMKLVHDWYMTQAAAIDPGARKMVFDDTLMGQLIRFVSSHEIGHTLGLRHNMGASSATPVEKLRDKAWVEEHGHTASIMDYARFNYVAQPEDNIGHAGIFPRINDYDKWAIQWGYTPIPDAATGKEELPVLNKWIKDSLSVNPRLWFSGEGKDYDPRSQSEDLGDNSMKAGEYGMKNLKRIVPHLIEWTREKDGDDYTNLTEMYKSVLNQRDRYLGHVLKNLAGVPQTAKSVDQAGAIYTYTPRLVQKEAVAFLCRHVLETQTWLLDTSILNRINNPALGDPLSESQTTMLMLMMSGGRLTRLEEQVNRFRDPGMYTPEELLSDIEAALWTELRSGKPIDFYRRKLQRAYVENLKGLIDANAVKGGIAGLIASMSAQQMMNSDMKFLAKVHLEKVQKMIVAAIPGTKDTISRQHLQYILYGVNQFFENKNK
ncbi:zinc-dependent metalloprotease [Filimonas effusa]|nr:zinc-dependent metalloprotease [Filimonas effusa]